MKTINGNLFFDMITGGAAYLSYQRKLVDSLNVFPVPDGDTGTNMTLTMSSAVKELQEADKNSLSDVALKVSKGALRGARGNSGVILSQIIKGFAVAFDGRDEADVKTVAEAFKLGAEIAYGAVTKPKEGTILTVVRVMAEAGYKFTNSRKNKDATVLDLLNELMTAGEDILSKTPDMLPVLKKAGVVDAGGKGLLSIMKGFLCVLTGEEIPEGDDEEEAHEESLDAFDFADDHDPDHIHYSYCTEFFVTNLNKKATAADIDKFRDKLMQLGDSLIVIGDLQLVKVHVHTNEPDKAMGYGLRLGELDKVKIENMVLQNRELQERAKKQKEEEAAEKEKKDTALISICAGEGFAEIFKDLGVDEVVEGGQTMNPSVYDILNAINRVDAKTVYIFPNNSNIILAANQAKELTDCTVVVMPTKNVPQGIAAILAYMPETDIAENVENMTAAMKRIKTGQITHAVRNTRMNGFHVREGDIIGLNDKVIVAKGSEVGAVTGNVIEKILSADDEIVTLYYGAEVTEDDAEQLAENIRQKHPDLEVMAYNGGQPHYYYMLAIE